MVSDLQMPAIYMLLLRIRHALSLQKPPYFTPFLRYRALLVLDQYFILQDL